MKHFFLLLGISVSLLFTACTQQRLCAQARESRTVVLDIGHYYHPERGGQGARTPDSRYGSIEECEFWYRNVIHTKRIIEQAGYTCRICNRGAAPTNKKLAEAGKKAGVHQVNTPVVTGIYRSRYQPRRMAVGMLSVDYALDQKPACVVFLHHNSHTNHWMVYNKGAMYCNSRGGGLAWEMADVINKTIFEQGMPNNGIPCTTILRNDGRRGGGDWLNACEETCVPAVITEAAYLSNPQHAQFLATPAEAKRYAEAIGQGIVNYLNKRG